MVKPAEMETKMDSAETGTMADQKATGNQEAKAEPTEQKTMLEQEGKTEGHGVAEDHSRVNSETAFMAIIGNSQNSGMVLLAIAIQAGNTGNLKTAFLAMAVQAGNKGNSEMVLMAMTEQTVCLCGSRAEVSSGGAAAESATSGEEVCAAQTNKVIVAITGSSNDHF